MAEATQYVSLTLDSVEELSLFLTTTSFDFDMRQLEIGKAPVAIEAVSLSSAVLMKSSLSGRTHQVSGLAARSYTFGIPLAKPSVVKFGNVAVNREILTLFDSDGGLDAVSEPGFAAITASFDADSFESVLASLGLDAAAFRSGAGSRHLPLPAARAAALRASLLEAIHTARAAGHAYSELLANLQTELATAFTSAQLLASCSRKNRARVLRAALDYIYTHLHERITVEQLCRESASSISTLERAFREGFGVSPKRYLTAVRLSGVRRALLHSNREESVGDIAAGLGFWHLSKMAADYRRMFGELPSQTRRAA